RRSVLHHTGTAVSWRVGHCRLGRSMAGNGRYFFEGSFNMAHSLTDTNRIADETSPHRGGSSGFQPCLRRLVARSYLRLGRKKEERTKQRRGAASGLAQLFVA